MRVAKQFLQSLHRVLIFLPNESEGMRCLSAKILVRIRQPPRQADGGGFDP